MAPGDHVVVLMLRGKEFSITSRHKTESRLAAMKKRDKDDWDAWIVLAEGVDKQTADTMRDRVRAEFIAEGYTYQTRTPLS